MLIRTPETITIVAERGAEYFSTESAPLSRSVLKAMSYRVIAACGTHLRAPRGGRCL
jgi:hypothetical protein